MALDALLQSLTRDAEHESEALLEQARGEAARIRAEADARVARRCADAVAVREIELRDRADGARARASREARARLLDARRRLLDRVRAATEEALRRALDAPERAPVLAALVREAIDFLPEVPVIARCPTALVARVRAAASGLDDLRVEGDDAVPPGVLMQPEDGSVVVDNTLDGRLRRVWPELSIELLAQVGAPA